MDKQEEVKELRKQLPEIPNESYVKLYGIKDIKFGFTNILQFDNDMVAARAFADTVNKFGNNINAHPEDYELHYLGMMCHQTGEIFSDRKFIGSATTYFDEAQNAAMKKAILESAKNGKNG